MSRFDPDTLTLGDELDRLADRYDELQSNLEDAESGSEQGARWRREIDDVAQEGSEVEWLISGDGSFDGYGRESEITVRGLHAGEYAETENRTSDANARSTGQGGVPGTGKVLFAASGLVDAPWLGDGHPYLSDTLDPGNLDDRVRAFVGGNGASEHGLPVGVRKWVEDLVSERTQRSGNWRDSAGPSREKGSDN